MDIGGEDVKRIKKLEESVVNKIAAGEIIVQPSNALKELLENSLDAGCSMINVLAKDGGLKLLQIDDNGKGINVQDLGLLCERFATSKLSNFEDLENIGTYGFRGEALASISHISRLSVVTKTQDSPLAYKAYYLNGKIVDSNFRSSSEQAKPKPTAGSNGTQITVEDLFYNVPSRLRTFRSKNDEFMKILDVVGRYAVHSRGVGFSCKKFGEPHQLLMTRPDMNLKDRIRAVYGSSVSNELIEFDISGMDESEEERGNREKYGLVSLCGALSNSDHDNKRRIKPIFFINNRLVSCEPLKRAINSIYQLYLPKGNQPFYYLSLEIESRNVDVNIHPTKREVRFLHEDELVDIVCKEVNRVLLSADSSRSYSTQKVISKPSEDHSKKRTSDKVFDWSALQKPLRQENKMVRIDAQQAKLNLFLLKGISGDDTDNDSRDRREVQLRLSADSDFSFGLSFMTRKREKERVKVELDSIASLQEEFVNSVDRDLTHIFNNSSYIGIVDELKRLCCFQYEVNLFICDYAAVLHAFFYQISLFEFCNFGEFQLSQKLTLQDILSPLYSTMRESNMVPMDTVIQKIVAMSDMFDEYFQIKLSYDSENRPVLEAIPMLLPQVKPSLLKMPYFLYRLGARVNYNHEKSCLHEVMEQIALLYIPDAIPRFEVSLNGTATAEVVSLKKSEMNHSLETQLFPAMKQRFLAPNSLSPNILQIADLPGLYRVFERC